MSRKKREVYSHTNGKMDLVIYSYDMILKKEYIQRK